MEEIFKGKTVAFVGQSPILEGKSLGSEIDSFDLVYRTNYITKKVTDYGSRCDVISVLKDFFKLLPSHQIKNIVVFDDIDLPDRNKYIVSVEERQLIRQKYIDEYGIDVIDATAGLVAYYLSTKFGAKSFKFYGVTGYQNMKGMVVNHSDAPHYTDEAYETLGSKERVLNVDMNNYECHDFKKQNDLFKILLRDNLITMDNYSLEYFK